MLEGNGNLSLGLGENPMQIQDKKWRHQFISAEFNFLKYYCPLFWGKMNMDTSFKNDKNHLQKKSEKRTGICDSTFDKILKKFHCLSNCLFNCVFFSGLNFFFYRKKSRGLGPSGI